MASATTSFARATPERAAELHENITEIRARIQNIVTSSSTAQERNPTLVAVSKYKPAADVLACYDLEHRDFGENYVHELVDKAAQLPGDIRWHFIGTLQSNKAKILASIPNLYAIQTVTSVKAATALNKSIPPSRTAPLNILLQVNTSGEDNKSGLPPLSPTSPDSHELTHLARHIITHCPHLYLQGLMTIGSLTESMTSLEKPNHDFEVLKETRDLLHDVLLKFGFEKDQGSKWGVDGKLVLSMGMSSDFEAALKSGSDIVRVGTGIFGGRAKKGETI